MRLILVKTYHAKFVHAFYAFGFRIFENTLSIQLQSRVGSLLQSCSAMRYNSAYF